MLCFSQAIPVWSCAKGEVSDQYRLFRKKFVLPENFGKVTLDIAADSTFLVLVNGTRLKIQQLADFPADRTVSSCDISELVNAGENIIAVEVHYIGATFLTYRAGEAFLCAEIRCGNSVVAATDESWKCCVSPDMQSGLNCKLTTQLGFVFCQDARKAVPFGSADFDDSAWANAVKVSDAENWHFSPRMIPQLDELPHPESVICQMGYLRREKELATFAETAFRDYLAPRRPREFFSVFDEKLLWDDMVRRNFVCKKENGFDLTLATLPADADGYYIVLDCGRETVGFINAEIFLPDGAVVDICHGEHLDDGRVRSLVGNRNFADRFIARDGWNQIFHNHRRIGGRYLELHITNCGKNEVKFRYAGILPLEVPLPLQTYFASEDRLMAKINEVSVDTLKLCMHEHYEDCPWREQGLYPYDSRNQILYGYYLWGNYDYVAACLDLLGKSFDGKRYLELTSPGYTTLTIPVFTLVWITELYEYYLFSGSTALTEKWLGQVDAIVDAALAEKVENMPDLYHSGVGSKIWNFSEWNGELSSLKEHPQAPYNIYLVETLRSAASLHESMGNAPRAAFLREKADALGKAVEKAFYSETMKCYTAIAGKDDRGYEHIQAVMLANELVAPEHLVPVLVNFAQKNLCGIDFSALYYLVSGFMKSDEWARQYVVTYLREILEPVVLSGATSLWETRQGADDFGYAGSLCHGWSSVMPYFCGSCLLGVKPLTAGFKKFEVKPIAGDLTHADGSVPTPSGMILVSWKRDCDGMHIKVRHPENLECVISEYPEYPVVEAQIVAYKPGQAEKMLWISHRGESLDAPENTLPAFALSLERNSDGMECDVRFTADRKVVCNHDGNLKRVGGKDVNIADTTFDELQKFDVSNNIVGFSDTRVPLFADSLAFLGKGRQYFVEIKGNDPEMAAALIKEVDDAGIDPSQITMISFKDNVVANYKRLAPERKALLLCNGTVSVSEVIGRLFACNADGVDIAAVESVDQNFVDMLHRVGYEVGVWTVDDAEKAARFAAMGVDAITSNCAAELKKQLN